LKTGNCPTTNDKEELFDIEGLTSYEKQKAKINLILRSSKLLSELKKEKSIPRIVFNEVNSNFNSEGGAVLAIPFRDRLGYV